MIEIAALCFFPGVPQLASIGIRSGKRSHTKKGSEYSEPLRFISGEVSLPP